MQITLGENPSPFLWGAFSVYLYLLVSQNFNGKLRQAAKQLGKKATKIFGSITTKKGRHSIEMPAPPRDPKELRFESQITAGRLPSIKAFSSTKVPLSEKVRAI